MAPRIKRKSAIIENGVVTFDGSTAAHPDVSATMNEEDWLQFSGTRWSATKRANGLYVRGRVARKSVLLHRAILNPPQDVDVDHRDGHPLNNCRTNLRTCTQAENNIYGADRRRGFAAIAERHELPTSPHVVRARLADGSFREYQYPTRSKSGTKTVVIRKIAPAR